MKRPLLHTPPTHSLMSKDSHSKSRTVPNTPSRSGTEEFSKLSSECRDLSVSSSSPLSRSSPAIHFVKQEGFDDIDPWRTLFEEHGVKTVADLHEGTKKVGLFNCVSELYEKTREESPFDFITHLVEAAELGYTVEEALLAKTYFVGKSESNEIFVDAEKVLKGYEEKAVAVNFSGQSEEQGGKFSLVLGSSGSGKSIFALLGAPGKLFEERHFTCMTLAAKITTGWNVHSNRTDAYLGRCKEALQKEVRALIDGALSTYKDKELKFKEGQKLEGLNLCVVLDEAGITPFSSILKDACKIEVLASALGEISDSYHLILVGTSLADITKHLDSNVPMRKFRMETWGMDEFEATNPGTQVIKIVKQNSLLQQLISNGRCAYFLTNVINRMGPVFSSNNNGVAFKSQTAVNSIITEVVRRYISTNGLIAVSGKPKEAQLVVRALLRALHLDHENYFRSKINEGGERRLEFPDFRNNLPPDKRYLENHCRGLVDIHLETTNGLPRLDEEKFKYTASISPALALVLAVLVGGDDSISWNWSRFETTVATGELMLMLRKTDDLSLLPLKLYHSTKQFPGMEGDKVYAPTDPNGVVIVNGDKADYADIITTSRLGKTKFAFNGGKAELPLLEEICNLGVTNNMHYEKQQRLTAHLSNVWQDQKQAPHENETPIAKHVPSDIAPVNSTKIYASAHSTVVIADRGCHYPASLLIMAPTPSDPLGSIEVPESEQIPDCLKVQVVFVTNGSSFHIPSFKSPQTPNGWKKMAKVLGLDVPKETKESTEAQRDLVNKHFRTYEDYKESYDIGKDDVDIDGKLFNDGKLPAYIRRARKNGVECRFLFYQKAPVS